MVNFLQFDVASEEVRTKFITSSFSDSFSVENPSHFVMTEQEFDAVPLSESDGPPAEVPTSGEALKVNGEMGNSPSSDPTKKVMIPREAYFSVLVVWAALFCDYILLTMAVPIFPQLGVSESQTGLLFSMKAMLQVTSSPFVARYVDSFDLEPVVVGLTIEALSCVVFAMTEDYGWWCVARAISGISSSAVISSGFLHIQRVFVGDNERLGHAMSIVATGIISGVTMGPPLGGILYGVDKRLPFISLIVLISCSAALTLKLQKQKFGGFGLCGTVQTTKGKGAVVKKEIEDGKVVMARIKNLFGDKVRRRL